MLARIRPIWGVIGKLWLEFGKLCADSSSRVQTGRARPILVRFRLFVCDVGQFWVEIDHFGPPLANSGSNSVYVVRSWPNRLELKVGELGPLFFGVGFFFATLAKNGSNLTNAGHHMAPIPLESNLGASGPIFLGFGDVFAKLAELGRCRPTLAHHAPNSVNCVRCWPIRLDIQSGELGPCCSASSVCLREIGQCWLGMNSTNVGQHWPILARMQQMLFESGQVG